MYSSVKFFLYIVEGRQFSILTDHKPLTYAFLQKSSQASPRQQRQLDFIGQHTTNIEYVAGEHNTVADALSRIAEINMPVVVSTKDLALHQDTDEELQCLLEPGSSTLLDLRKIRVDGTETGIYCDVSGPEIRPYVPRSLRKRVFDMAHGPSHPSRRATKKLISQRFVWPSMNRDIIESARTCLPCQRTKISRHNINVPQHIAIPDSRFYHIHLDIVGPLLPCQGYRYLLTMIDRFTRWPEAVPIADISADTVVRSFFSGWVSRFGAPAIVTTDRGSQFESQLFRALTNLVGCERTRTTAYHLASNGMIERWHLSLKTAITCHGSSNWIDVLPVVLLGIRTTYKKDLKVTSAELLYGTTLRLPGEFFIDEEPSADLQIFVEHFRELMRSVRSAPAAHHNKKKPFAHKMLYTCTHVWVRVDAVQKPLEFAYEGPYEVLERITDFVLLVNVKGQAETISPERLKPAFFVTSEPPLDIPQQGVFSRTNRQL